MLSCIPLSETLTPINGWTNYGSGTANAAARKSSNIVHFEGAIATSGTSATAFVLPTTFRPKTDVYVPIDLCNATNGRLHIIPSGSVNVEAQTFSSAQCFTSLDGASFAIK